MSTPSQSLIQTARANYFAGLSAAAALSILQRANDKAAVKLLMEGKSPQTKKPARHR